MEERNIPEELVISTLFSEDFLYVSEQIKTYQDQNEKRYKLVSKISSKYCLIIVINYNENILKVINVIKTTKDLEKKWLKKIS